MLSATRANVYYANHQLLATSGRWLLAGSRTIHKANVNDNVEAITANKKHSSHHEVSKDNIVIPKKIPRDELTILKALASTVQKDIRGPAYGIVDDPRLIPYATRQRDMAVLAKASGRKTARYLMHKSKLAKLVKHPPVYDSNLPVPVAFNYPVRYQHSPYTLEGLVERIERARPKEAVKSYEKNSKRLSKEGLAIPENVERAFFEMHCFTNDRNVPTFGVEESLQYQSARDLFIQPEKRWRPKNQAEYWFKKKPNPDPAMYEAIIRGKLKFGDKSGALSLFQEMRDKKLPVTVEIYNALLGALKGQTDLAEQIMKLLKEMSKNNVQPNAKTFMNASANLNGRDKQLNLPICNEMIAIGIEPPVGMYYRVLSSFYYRVMKCETPEDLQSENLDVKSDLLHEVLDRVRDKEYEADYMENYLFFNTAMRLCRAYGDKAAAYKTYYALQYKNNYKLVRKDMEGVVYCTFVQTLLHTEELHKVMKLYDKLIIFTASLRPDVYNDIIATVRKQKQYQYIPKLWADLRLQMQYFEGNAENIMEACTEVEFEENPLKQEILGVVLGLMKTMKDDDTIVTYQQVVRQLPARNFNTTTEFAPSGQVFGSMIQTLLNAEDFPHAWEVFSIYSKRRQSVKARMRDEHVTNLLHKCIVNTDLDKALDVLDVLRTSHSEKLKSSVEKVKTKLILSKAQAMPVDAMLERGDNMQDTELLSIDPNEKRQRRPRPVTDGKQSDRGNQRWNRTNDQTAQDSNSTADTDEKGPWRNRRERDNRKDNTEDT